MKRKEEDPHRLQVRADRLGSLPIVNHFLDRLRLEPTFERFVPTSDPRSALSHAKSLGVLLRSIIVEREPVYRQQETVEPFAAGLFGIKAGEVRLLNDDRIGRALDRLYDADRAALGTELVIRLSKHFKVRFDRLHNDSTTIRFCGNYRAARGRWLRGKQAPWITYGKSKDHRPDLKQLLFILTTSADGGVPVQFRCAHGNTEDSQTHIETWNSLRELTGTADFLYVADSKLCSRENLDYIDQNGGRLVTVIPRSRLEDSEFRNWIQANEPDWELVWDREPRRKNGPRDQWYVFRYHIPSREAWPVTWVYSSLLALRQEQARRERIARAVQDLEELKRKLASPKSRLRKASEVDQRIEEILAQARARDYVRVERAVEEDHSFRQKRPGRPGPTTEYRKVTRKRFDVTWEIDEAAIAYERKSDGMYPLLTNDRSLTPAQVLEAHKAQPQIEKRFEQTKTVHEIAPVFLKNEGRVEALFFLYFVALLVQGLIEREVRLGMDREDIKRLPLYPEERFCRRPTTDRMLELFAHAQRITVSERDKVLHVAEPPLTEMQKTILRLLRVPARSYSSRA